MTGVAKNVDVWEDDPGVPGEPGRIMTVARSKLPSSGTRPIKIDGRAPKPGDEPGTPGFRYWTAVDALSRARAVWDPCVPAGTRWVETKTLAVDLDAGDEINAYYERGALLFHRADVFDATARRTIRVHIGESPDIVAHEFGHAVLDAVRPELWDAPYAEVAAFHEAFGDISALLTQLQVPSVRDELVALSGGTIFQSSRLSRIGEQMGWALRQRRPDIPDRTALRDAVNTFFYVPPETLSAQGPSSVLSSEPHNFARVFVAAFLRVLDEMLKVEPKRTSAALAKVTATAAELIIAAVRSAPIGAKYYRNVALAMVRAERDTTKGRYSKAITTGFVRHGVLTVGDAHGAVAQERTGRRRRVGAAASTEAHADARWSPAAHDIDLTHFGIRAKLLLEIAPPRPRLGAAATPEVDEQHDRAAEFFVGDLLRRNRIDVAPAEQRSRARELPMRAPSFATHQLRPADGSAGGAVRIARLRVDCCCAD